jgi:tRNA(adenine34) deaminase
MKIPNQDEHYIKRCIELANMAGSAGEFPFGAVVVLNGILISEGHNDALAQKEVYRHAEMLALVDAQKKLTREQLSECILYSSVEPCAMCSFAVQELNIRRVVFGLRSPIMGGYSKWHILQDELINTTFPNTFGRTPEVVPDVLKDQVIDGWKQWNNEKWERMYAKGVFK